MTRPTRLGALRPFISTGLGTPIVAATSSNTLALADVVVQNAAGSNYHFVSTSSNSGIWVPHDDDDSETPIEHGSMGSTETIDVGEGTWHRGTLNADCDITVTGFTNDTGIVALVGLLQDGTGGWDVTWDADVDFGGADDQPDQTAGAITWYVLWSNDGNADIFGAKVGGGGSSVAALDDLTDVVITSVASNQRLRYDGSFWRNSSLIWKPLTVSNGTNYLPLVDGTGNSIMAEAEP